MRPGPIQGGMVHPYLRRRQGLEPVTYPSEAVRQVLERTLGVPIFQEQVMQLAMVAAGFTPGEADALRRSMAAWKRKGGLEPFERRIKEGMRRNGYAPGFAEAIYRQILGFGEYGFPESHSASFALLVYVSAWLKRHRPAAFLAALLNSQPMGFYAPAQIVRDARQHGVDVRPPDVGFSDWDSTLEGGTALRLGLREVDGLRQEDAHRIIAGRGTITELHGRSVPVAALERLAAADCFRSLGLDRRAALWQVKALARATPLPLFAFAATSDRGAEPPIALPSMPLSEHVVNDYQTLRLSLKAHPMEFLRLRCEKERVIDNRRLRQARNGAFVTVAGIVLVRQRPGSAKGVVFLTLEDEFAVCNAVVWPQVLESHRAIVMGARLMLIRGRVQRVGDIIHVVAARIDDRTSWLAFLMEDGRLLRNPLARADEVARPGPDPQPAARHPRQMRIIPKSRDFH